MRYVSSIEEITIEETRKEIVLVMLSKGLSVEEIASLTDIPIEQVTTLQSRSK
jgi:predicted transposase YdaD